MIVADLLYDVSQHVLISNTWVVDAARMTIAIVAALVAIFLGRLYLTHRTGRMNVWAGSGAIGTYVVIAWAQLVAISTPTVPHDLTALNVAVLIVVALSLVGTLQVMNVRLFRR